MLDMQLTIVLFVILAVCYFLFGKNYRNRLITDYGYDFIGIPTFIAIAGPLIYVLRAWGGSGEEPSVIAVVFGMLLFATPGVIISTLVCLKKTRDTKITMMNIPLIYVIAFVAGGGIAAAIMVIIVVILLKGFASSATHTAGGNAGACPNCGTVVRGSGACPTCGTNLL